MTLEQKIRNAGETGVDDVVAFEGVIGTGQDLKRIVREITRLNSPSY